MNDSKVICDYCGKKAEFVTGREIYPHRPDLFDLRFWRCRPCKAYTGCHLKNPRHGIYRDDEPKGRLATATLRRLRIEAHEAFDKYWKKKGAKTHRRTCYWKLAEKMKIPFKKCHIGFFNEDQCKEVIEICKRGLFK